MSDHSRSVRLTNTHLSDSQLSGTDLRFLRRCVDLAREGLEGGDDPFGSLLVDEHGTVRFEDHNHVQGGDATRHPEFEIARWAAEHLTPQERARSTVYTSGEHCAMCAAAHAWVGLGKIVYATSTEQLSTWYAEWRLPPAPIALLPIHTVAPNISVAGPALEFADEVRAMHAQRNGVNL